jgi:hypothetical protein
MEKVGAGKGDPRGRTKTSPLAKPARIVAGLQFDVRAPAQASRRDPSPARIALQNAISGAVGWLCGD